MNTDELGGIVRAIVAAIGGIAVTKGYLDNATVVTISGAVATIVVAVWSVVAKRRAAPAK